MRSFLAGKRVGDRLSRRLPAATAHQTAASDDESARLIEPNEDGDGERIPSAERQGNRTSATVRFSEQVKLRQQEGLVRIMEVENVLSVLFLIAL